jgi:Ras-related protein Rab-2A
MKTIKIVVCGDGAVGKTTLIKRITKNNEDLNNMPPIKMTPGVDIDSMTIPNSNVIGSIWDLGGQCQFRFMQDAFLRGLDILILLYSVEWYHSFTDLSQWLKIIPPNYHPKKIYLIANKIDAQTRILLPEDGIEFAEQINASFFEMSAITGKNVEEFKQDLVNAMKIIAESKELKKNYMIPNIFQPDLKVV